MLLFILCKHRENIFLWVTMDIMMRNDDEMKNYEVDTFQGVKCKLKILNLDHIFGPAN